MASIIQPLGTVIASMLNYDQLCQNLTPIEAPAFLPTTSTYAPCDGRPILNSRLNTLTGVAVAPDLRGRFLRGLNQFYNLGEAVQIPPGSNDPDARFLGSFQSDDFKSHVHENIPGASYQEYRLGEPETTIGLAKAINATSGAKGGAETRPKNIAVYYYVKIN